MDTAFFTGMSAFLSAILIFVGSAFLLMSLVMGARLAYFVTASITLCFVLIMAVVWSINPLGPLGRSPQWEPIGADEDVSAIDFDDAAAYPEDPWKLPSEDDAAQTTQASELESDATKFVAQQITAGKIQGFPSVPQFSVAEDSTRLLIQGDSTFGATTIEVLPPVEQPELGIPRKEDQGKEEETGAESTDPLGTVAVVAEYDPGNPLGTARRIALGTFVLLVLHLFGLSLSERRVRARQAGASA